MRIHSDVLSKVEAMLALGGPDFTVNVLGACRPLRKGFTELKLLQDMVSSQLDPNLHFHFQP